LIKEINDDDVDDDDDDDDDVSLPMKAGD